MDQFFYHYNTIGNKPLSTQNFHCCVNQKPFVSYYIGLDQQIKKEIIDD